MLSVPQAASPAQRSVRAIVLVNFGVDITPSLSPSAKFFRLLSADFLDRTGKRSCVLRSVALCERSDHLPCSGYRGSPLKTKHTARSRAGCLNLAPGPFTLCQSWFMKLASGGVQHEAVAHFAMGPVRRRRKGSHLHSCGRRDRGCHRGFGDRGRCGLPALCQTPASGGHRRRRHVRGA